MCTELYHLIALYLFLFSLGSSNTHFSSLSRMPADASGQNLTVCLGVLLLSANCFSLCSTSKANLESIYLLYVAWCQNESKSAERVSLLISPSEMIERWSFASSISDPKDMHRTPCPLECIRSRVCISPACFLGLQTALSSGGYIISQLSGYAIQSALISTALSSLLVEVPNLTYISVFLPKLLSRRKIFIFSK